MMLWLCCQQSFAQAPGWYIPPNLYLTLPFNRIDDVYFISPDTGLIATGLGTIHKTYDGGTNWSTKYTTFGFGSYFRSIEFNKHGNCGIVGSLYGQIYRSTDAGETWTDISANISDTGLDGKKMCGLGHWNNTFYGVGWWGSGTARVYKSVDSGLTWTTSYLDTSIVSGLVDVVCVSADTLFASGFQFHGTPAVMRSVVIKSTNAGQTWSRVFMDTVFGGRIWKLQFLNGQFGVGSIEPLYADTVAMIKTTNGGQTWQTITAGHRHSTYYGTQGIGFASPTHGWIGGYYTGIFETKNGGNTWTLIDSNMDLVNRFFYIDSTRMYASGVTVYKYRDTVQYTPPSLAVANPAAPRAYSHTLHPVSPNPATGRIKIEFDLKYRSNTLLQVVSVDSRQIFTISKGLLSDGHYTYYWNSDSAPRGNYLIWLGTDEAPIVQKFVLK